MPHWKTPGKLQDGVQGYCISPLRAKDIYIRTRGTLRATTVNVSKQPTAHIYIYIYTYIYIYILYMYIFAMNESLLQY